MTSSQPHRRTAAPAGYELAAAGGLRRAPEEPAGAADQHHPAGLHSLLDELEQSYARASAGSLFIIGLAIAYGLVSNSILGYALTVARDREQGVFQRLRVTPAPTWTIMTSRLAMQVLANLVITVIVVIVGSSNSPRLTVGRHVRTGSRGLDPRRCCLPQHRAGARRPGEIRRQHQRRRPGARARPRPARHRSVRAGRSAAPGNRSRAGPPSAWS